MYRKGLKNDITDVPGVRVGQTTIHEGNHHTGVTVVIPCEGNIFDKKPVAAVHVLNGFGKTCGSIQVEELGMIETPIALTNTLSVGAVADALVRYTVEKGSETGNPIYSVNPVVGETNDCRINDIQAMIVSEAHVKNAIACAGQDLLQGAVGAGSGTICYGFKGGIGSASRVITVGAKDYTLGILTQTNFGRMQDFTLHGKNIGAEIAKKLKAKEEAEKGSVMVILATDLPLTARQLKRVLKRVTVGLVRTGSFMGHGSGDIFIGFTNGNYMGREAVGDDGLVSMKAFPEGEIDQVFRAVADATEEAVLNSLFYAKTMTGFDGKTYYALSDFTSQSE